MKRREFLMTAAAVAAAAGSRSAWAQAPKGAKQSTLDRIAIMTLNFQSILKVPDVQDSPTRTLELFDVARDDRGHLRRPQGGVPALPHSVDRTVVPEGAARQHREEQVADDADQPRVLRAEHLGAAAARPAAGDRPHEGVDRSRGHARRAARDDQPGQPGRGGSVMPTHENKVYSIPTLKTMADYGRSKGIIVSVETRGGGGGGRGRRSAAPAPQRRLHRRALRHPPTARLAMRRRPRLLRQRQRRRLRAAPHPPACRSRRSGRCWRRSSRARARTPTWTSAAPDAANQEELHQCLKMMFPMTAGHHAHARQRALGSRDRDRFLEGELGYKGLYTIEASNGHEGTRRFTTSSWRRFEFDGNLT